jgi:hypothetical protein
MASELVDSSPSVHQTGKKFILCGFHPRLEAQGRPDGIR